MRRPAPSPTPNTRPFLTSQPRSGSALHTEVSPGHYWPASASTHLFTVRVRIKLVVFTLYGGYLISPSFSVNQPRSFFSIG